MPSDRCEAQWSICAIMVLSFTQKHLAFKHDGSVLSASSSSGICLAPSTSQLIALARYFGRL